MHIKKPMIDKEEIRREQCAYLDMVRERYRLTLTEIAARSGVNQTTITRFYNSKDAKHVLSSVTLQKVRAHFPLEEKPKQEISDAEVALTDALKVMMQIFLHHGLASSRSFIAAFSSLEDDYQAKSLPNAAQIMQELSTWVSGDPLHPDDAFDKESVRKILQLPRPGMA